MKLILTPGLYTGELKDEYSIASEKDKNMTLSKNDKVINFSISFSVHVKDATIESLRRILGACVENISIDKDKIKSNYSNIKNEFEINYEDYELQTIQDYKGENIPEDELDKCRY